MRPQIGRWMCALGLSAAVALTCVAEQRPAKTPAAHSQPQPAAGRQPNQPRNDRPPNAGGRGGAARGNVNPNASPNRPPNASVNRPPSNTRPGAQMPQQRFRNLPPQEKQRVLQNNQRLKQLPPAQQQELRDRARVWQQMTPQQRDHIKNDVLPKWNQMSPQRQKAISNRLAVLKNMPESARNQHLTDPNFTRGMSEEDKQTLRDLSHMHVGGPPEAPTQSAPRPEM